MNFRSNSTTPARLYKKQTSQEKIAEEFQKLDYELKKHSFEMFLVIVGLMLVIFVLAAYLFTPRMESTLYYNGGMV